MALHQVGKFVGDKQSQAGAQARFFGIVFVLGKSFEQYRLQIFRNAGAGIGHAKDDVTPMVLAGFDAKHDTALLGKFLRVVEEVQQYLSQAGVVGFDIALPNDNSSKPVSSRPPRLSGSARASPVVE